MEKNIFEITAYTNNGIRTVRVRDDNEGSALTTVTENRDIYFKDPTALIVKIKELEHED